MAPKGWPPLTGHLCSHVPCVSAVSSLSSPLATGRQSRPSSEEPAQPYCTGRCAFTWSFPSPRPDHDFVPWAPGPLASPLPIPGHPGRRGVTVVCESHVDWCLNRAYCWVCPSVPSSEPANLLSASHISVFTPRWFSGEGLGLTEMLSGSPCWITGAPCCPGNVLSPGSQSLMTQAMSSLGPTLQETFVHFQHVNSLSPGQGGDVQGGKQQESEGQRGL